MKKMILSILLVFMMITSNVAALSNIETKRNNINESVQSTVEAKSFSITLAELNLLTTSDVILKSYAVSNNGEEVFVDKSSLDSLKSNPVIGINMLRLYTATAETFVEVVVLDNPVIEASVQPSVQVEKLKFNARATGIVVNAPSSLVAGVSTAVTVAVDFGDDTSTGKEVEITLPEGIKYITYPVSKRDPIPNTPEVNASSMLNGFLTGVTTATKMPVYDSYTGKVKYSVASGVRALEIPLTIAVDEKVYYGPKTFTNAISVVSNKSGAVYESNAKQISATGNVTFSQADNYPMTEINTVENSTNQVSTNTSLLYRSPINNITYAYLKKAKLRYYFPKELHYVSAKPFYSGVSYGTILNPSTIQTDGYVDFEVTDAYYAGHNLANILTLDTRSTPAGTYIASENNFFEVTFYDGTTRRIDTAYKQVANVIDLNSVAEKLQIRTLDTYFYDADDSYTVPAVKLKIMNDTYTVKNDQYLEYNIGTGYLVDEFVIPVPKSAGLTIEYQTNLNNNKRVAIGNQILEASTVSGMKSVKITRSSLGLAQGEYLIYAKTLLDSKGLGWMSNTDGDNAYKYSVNTAQIRGRLDKGVNIAAINVRTFKQDASGNIITDTFVESASNVIRIEKNQVKSDVNVDAKSITVNAGYTKKADFSLFTSDSYLVTNTQVTVDPILYVRVPKGVVVDTSTVVAKDSLGVNVPTEVRGPYKSSSGETFVEVKALGIFGGLLNGVYKSVNISMDFQTSITAEGVYNWKEYAFVQEGLLDGALATGVADTLDVDNDGNTTEKFRVPFKTSSFIIIPDESLLVDTYIKSTDGNRLPSYNPSNPSSAIVFTPEDEAIYTVDIYNNGKSVIDSLTTYIPIPKEGINYGARFQSDKFNWNMKLTSAPTLQVLDLNGNDVTSALKDRYVIEYSVDATNESNYDSATYSTLFTPDAKMIKITNNSGIALKERAIYNLDYIVDESTISVLQAPAKLESINDFRPAYTYVITPISATQEGTRVGAKLVSGSIEGRVFEDVDKDGVFSIGDRKLANRRVTILDSSNAVVKQVLSDANGNYIADGLGTDAYTVDFVDGLEVGEEYTFVDKSADFLNNSYAEMTGANRGKIVNLFATSNNSKYANIGIIKYSASDLSVAASPKNNVLAADNGTTKGEKQLSKTITPSFFDTIKADVDAIVWSSTDTNVVVVDQNGKITAVNVGTATVKIEITDMYGNKAFDTVAVEVTTNEVPVIVADDITVELGSTFDPLATPTATDSEDGDITSDLKVKSNNVDTSKVGSYVVELEVTDSIGNTVTKSYAVSVVDTTKPVISANDVTYERLSVKTEAQYLVDASASMNEAGTLTSNFDTVVDLNVVGSYTVTLTATDSSGNTTTKNVTVTVVDTTKPVITANDVTYEKLSVKTEAEYLVDASASMNEAGTLTSNFDTAVDLDVVGTYTVTITATDSSGNTATKDVKVNVVDTTKPVITANDVTYERSTTKTEAEYFIDASASMNEAGTLTSNFATAVDLEVAGAYPVTLTATDSFGNTATKDVVVNVVDTTKPVITAHNVTYEMHSVVPENKFLENVEAKLSENGTIRSNFLDMVNLLQLGDYTVTLVGIDMYGNAVSKDVIVTVKDNEKALYTDKDEITITSIVAKRYTLNDIITATNARALNLFTHESLEIYLKTPSELEQVNSGIVGQYKVTIKANPEREITINVVSSEVKPITPVVQPKLVKTGSGDLALVIYLLLLVGMFFVTKKWQK